MNTQKNESFLFANEDHILRIVFLARITSWVVLVFYLISFANEASRMFQGQMTWPSQLSQWPIAIASLFFAPVIGLFYFLVLQGVAQALNLGLDIFYELNPGDDNDDDDA